MRKKNKLVLTFFSGLLSLAAVGTSAFSVMPVYAQTIELMSEDIGILMTNEGVVGLDRGSASITIRPNDISQPLVGKKFCIYKLFDAENAIDLESINYTWNEKYKSVIQTVVGSLLGKEPDSVTEYDAIDYIQSLNDFEVEGAQSEQKENGRYSAFRYFIEALRDELVKFGSTNADMVAVTNVRVDGSVLIDGLEYGYYVIDEVTANQNRHSAASLCMVDTANPFAMVKVKSDYPSIMKKVQEDDNRDEVGNDGWNDMADYEIGQNVPYKFVSNIPNLNGYHTYYYAWHDILDEVLTFHPDSVEIVISDADGTKYKLSANEFNVKENITNVEGDMETFVVEIQNIKSIVDTHFNKIDSLGQNTYGQSVTLTYNATLSDKAALYTGLPGFENDVRLEFSNNPDCDGKGETGFTPWDTVVCFTYRLDGLKVNTHNKVLENAKFRLYSDEKCTEEVYLKENENGDYIVIHEDSRKADFPENAEICTDTNGVFRIIGLDGGTYYLKETEAPAGYRELLDPIVFTVSPVFAEDRNDYRKGNGASGKALIDLDFTAHIKEFLDGFLHASDTKLETDIVSGTGNLTVVNTVGTKLPVTGSSIALAMFCAGTSMMIFSGMKRRKKK